MNLTNLDFSKKKIIIFLVIPTLEIGGTETQVILLAQKLIKNGFNTKILVRKNLLNSSSITSIKPNIVELPNLPGPHPLILFKLFKTFLNSKSEIVVFSYLDQMNFSVGFLKLFLNFKWFSSERSDPKVFKDTFFRRLMIYFQRNSLVITNSDAGLNYYQNIGHRVLKINNFLRFSPTIYNDVSFDKTFYCYSRLVESKNIIFVLKAWKIAKIDSKLYIIGSGPTESELKQFVELNNMSNVFFMPDIRDISFLQRFSFFISASKFEGFPNSAIEALSLNNLLILSDIPSHESILKTNSKFLFDLKNVYSLVNVIKWVFRFDFELYSEFLLNQRNILCEFDNEIIFDSYVNLFQD